MASPGIEPGSPALQADTLSKELFRQFILFLFRTNSSTLTLVAGSAGVRAGGHISAGTTQEGGRLGPWTLLHSSLHRQGSRLRQMLWGG
jgi:hypothetical protein